MLSTKVVFHAGLRLRLMYHVICMYVDIYIYIYMYRERVRERDVDREREGL